MPTIRAPPPLAPKAPSTTGPKAPFTITAPPPTTPSRPGTGCAPCHRRRARRRSVSGPSACALTEVVEAGTDASRTTGRTHKGAFTLKPRDATTGGPWQIGHEDPGSTAHFGGGAPRP